jgi:phage terminase large subunit-like protein
VRGVSVSEQRLRDLQDYERYRKEWSCLFYKPYAKQKEFHDMGSEKRERALIAGNQLGKTLGAGMEIAYHLTGIYPDWWQGKRFDKPVRGWVAGVTGESTRDNPQRILIGPVGNHGSGTIPKDLLLKTSSARGIPDAVETVLVRHVSGGVSQATFKSYSDGREKWQGETLEIIWNDEEPPIDIYVEGLTRTNATGGIVMCTFTPLLGMSDVVIRFLKEPSQDRASVKMTIDDVDHYTADEKRKIIDGYPLHEREARARGEPMLGSGRIFPYPESWIEEDAIVVPETWYRLAGIDFGWDHPTAAVLLVGDSPDITKTTLHIVKAYRQARETPLIHCGHLKTWGDIPFAWPHDALQHDKGSGEQLKDIYKRNGLRMLSEKAQFPDDRGNGLEAGITEMLELMQQGRMKGDRNLHEWFDEFRTYHRKEGKVVKEREDLLSATRYAVMMWRYAQPQVRPEEKLQRYSKPRLKHVGATWMSI